MLFFGQAFFAARAQSEAQVNYFNSLSGEAWLKANADEAAKHFEIWKTASGEERTRQSNIVRFYAWRGGNMDMIDQLIADGRLAETEVTVPDQVEKVTVTVKYEVPADRGQYDRCTPVWRRITSSTFEVWTPHEGRLFDTKGNVIASAHPTRDKSDGREWFGAFLPDGHWITTELHEGDGRVYIFNRKGRCTYEIKSGKLLGDAPKEMLIVPWARSTGDGKTWLVRVGSEEGLGESLLDPDGSWRRRKKKESLWQLCQPRQLGVRLASGICFYKNESDDGKLEMTSGQPAHGQGVGNPAYDFHGAHGDDGNGGLGNIPSEGDVFGFWPRSHATHVFNGTRTWCFDASRHYRGWISGERVGDAADHQSMIFRLKDGRCVTVSPRLRATHMQRFQLADGQLLMPLELHPDIGLGIFCTDVPTGPDENQHMTTHELAVVRGAMQLIVGKWNPKEGN